MNVKIDETLLIELVSQKINQPVTSRQLLPVTGGSINNCFRLVVNKEFMYFVKFNAVSAFPSLLEKEQNGLTFIASQKIIRVPQIIAHHVSGDQQYLILEWIEPGIKNGSFWKLFGEQLAALHKISYRSYGFQEDNYMGALPQSNAFSENWTDFFIHYRLEMQTNLALQKGLLLPQHLRLFERLYKKLGEIFNEEAPSLLHGDLWSGNFISAINGDPVLIDPAVYFGHRNMDLGMTTLFGGFERSFYESYHYHFPFTDNYRDQWEICNLYPLLIHLNLFGTGYLPDIEAVLKKFVG